MPPPSQNVVRTWGPPVHLLPVEIVSIIFLLVVDNVYHKTHVQLMLVCRRWYAIMLSTPGIPARLWIRKSITMEMVRVSVQGTRWLLKVTIDMDGESIGEDFNADDFDACFMAAVEAASRWQSLAICSLSRPENWKPFQIVPPLKNLEFFSLAQGCDLGGFFEPLMTAVTTTALPHLTTMLLSNLTAVLYLVQPAYLHVFYALTTLTINLPKRMERPADILPHLQRLERFDAGHLHLPIYPPDAALPLTQTLRFLSLKSTSVQWMAGRVFPVLRSFSITFPHQIDTISFQPVAMPACTYLQYDSNDLDPLGCFHDLPLAQLTVKCGQWSVTRGNIQLIAISHMIVLRTQDLTGLDLDVRCSEQLLIYMLSLLPALEGLYLGLASPRALSETFFKAFIATESNTGSPCEMGRLVSLPLCLKLKELDVRYKRWLRGSERTALLQIFGDIVSSRNSEAAFQLRLTSMTMHRNGLFVATMRASMKL